MNPADHSNLIVSQNDQQGGYNQTSVSPSLDNGQDFFRNYAPPGLNKVTRSDGSEFAYPRCSDPASAHDGKGNLFYTCVAFNVPHGPETAVLAWRSNSCEQGLFLHHPSEQSCPGPSLNNTPATVVDNVADTNIFWDKELMAADTNPTSPFYGRVYITATRFDLDPACGGYCQSPIAFFQSSDGGVTWAGKRISGVNPHICNFGDFFDPHLNPHSCNFDQGSYPVVEPDGSIDVVFNNTNTPTLVAQQLFVRSTDGGATWSRPVKVADDFDTQPFNVGSVPDPYGCSPFRQCLPPNGYRMNDYPSMGIDGGNGKLAVFWADFRNGGPCATDPSTGLPVPPCANYNNDVFVSVSTNHGVTWSFPRQVTGPGVAAQWQQWGDVGEDGRLYVGYYDRKYGACESTGCNDITLAISGDDGSWSYQRITTGSMPNLTCANNPFQCGFLGDYMSTRYFGGTVYLVWADTRPRSGPTPDEDIYLAKLVPTP